MAENSEEQRLSPEAELLYKKMGQQKYNKLVENMQSIAERFKERKDRYEGVVREPLTPSTDVSVLIYGTNLILGKKETKSKK